MLTNNGFVYCPICRKEFLMSGHLFSVILDEKVLWIANMVTHYRHSHITWWNKCWGSSGSAYRQGWFGDYDTEKRKVNEEAKRKIIKLSHQFMIEHGITIKHLKQLQHNDEETLKIAEKYLCNQNLFTADEAA